MGKASLVVVVLVAMLCAEQAYAQTWQSLLPKVVSQLVSLWSRGNIEFLGKSCSYSQRPTINRFRLKWKNTFVCPGIGNFKGYCKTSSRSKGVNCAIEDFINDAVAAGALSQQQVSKWLGQQSG